MISHSALKYLTGLLHYHESRSAHWTLLHGGGHAAWLEAHGLAETIPMFPLMAKLESELRICRREVYLFMRQHDPAWLEKAEAHVRKEKAPTPRARGGGGRQTAAAAAAEGEAWLQRQVEASVFARDVVAADLTTGGARQCASDV